ncbi:hypothetical protein DXG03_008548 [Asterophora parasitica]|uniref:Uncharacterized protein n=1 Tax=Asterophora parasitica TaxID=117018 RepID=A0A9P7K8U9_9AGAR|nr:hypothetical protein DXG03_008548 [Asterophora parasitica]
MPSQPSTPLCTSYQPLPPTHTAIMATKTMPGCNSHNALVFDRKAVQELRRYFSNLELLFANCSITDEAEKKAYSCHYLNIDDHTLWKSIDGYTTDSYNDWKAKIFELHPGSKENARFNQTDLDLLLTTTRTTGICSLSKLGKFHHTYLNISNFLVSKGIIADLKRHKAFCSIFGLAAWTQIQSQLNIVKPNHAVGTPYTITEILLAATFYFKQASTISTDAITMTPGPQGKSKEAIISSIQHLEQAINTFTGQIQHLETGTRGGPPNQQLPPGPLPQNYLPPTRAPSPCNFCGGDNHYISACLEAECYIQDGKICQNTECRVAGLMLEVYQFEGTGPTTETLDIDDQIGVLEHKLLNLCRYREAFNGVKIWSKPPKGTFCSDPPKRDMPPHMSDASGPTTPSAAASPDLMTSISRPTAAEKGKGHADPTPITHMLLEPAAPQASRIQPTSPPVPLLPQSAPQPVPPHPHSPPIHPFSNIPDNRYVLPSTHNLAATDWCADPTYRMEAPITDAAKSTELFDCCLKSIMVSVGKLCSVAPAIWGKLRKAITPKRVMTAVLGSIVEVPDNHYTSCIEELDTLLMVEDAHSNSTPPPGALITTDIVDTYYQNLQPGKSPECVVVAKESHFLWSILMCIDAWEQVKCIMDSGCQIIAMSEEVCHDLHICYNPTVILHMQSANRTVDPSLGLAQNIPCTIGNITLYLQIHVIWNLAYDILLSRPFDVLTCSLVKMHLADETIITITNPNTHVVTSIPLFACGQHWHQPKPLTKSEAQSFQILLRK